MTRSHCAQWRVQRFETLEQKEPLAADLLSLGAITPVVHDVVAVAQDVVGQVDSAANHLLGASPLSTVQNTVQSALGAVGGLHVVDTVHDLAGGLLGGLLNNAAAVTTNLTASLSGVAGATATGSATFNLISNGIHGAAMLNVHIAGAEANSILPVTIDGTLVGNVQVNAAGIGSLVLNSNASATSGHLLPDLSVAANSTIQVGSLLSGTFTATAAATNAGVGLNVSALVPNTVDHIFALI